MNVLSVITPVHPPSAPHLEAAYASLNAQTMPEGWDWEWIVQQDGDDYTLEWRQPPDSRIRFATGRGGGPGVARTLSLARVTGSLVKVLDADDMLTAGALTRDIDVLARHPRVGWTTSRVLDLLPSGETVGFDNDPPEGTIQRGQVLDHWLSHDYRAQVHPATLCIRHDLLMALGGWMALPASEDTGLLLAADAVSDGYFTQEPGLLYRKWDGQSTSQPEHADADEIAARMRVVHERAIALRALVDTRSSTTERDRTPVAHRSACKSVARIADPDGTRSCVRSLLVE